MPNTAGTYMEGCGVVPADYHCNLFNGESATGVGGNCGGSDCYGSVYLPASVEDAPLCCSLLIASALYSSLLLCRSSLLLSMSASVAAAPTLWLGVLARFFFGLLRQQGSYCYDDYDRYCYRYCYEYTGSTTHRRRRMRALASRARSSMKSSILRVRTTSNGDSNSSNLRL